MPIIEESITNPMYRELTELGAIDPKGVHVLDERTRDRDIPVLIDETSGVIFLQHAETSSQYYETEKPEDREAGLTITTFVDGSSVKTTPLKDDQRRFEQIKDLTKNARICDFGCGYGGFLELNKNHAKSIAGVELREHCHSHLKAAVPEIDLKKNILEFDTTFDLITMFHVLEHIPTQTAVLTDIRRRLGPNGRIFVEVPHAGDFLIHRLGLPAFRAFTFWSEHLVLHTKESLRRILEHTGFRDIEIHGYQRYGFTNHLGWLKDGQPGGQETYRQLERPAIEAAYGDYLAEIDATDTLIAVATAGQN